MKWTYNNDVSTLLNKDNYDVNTYWNRDMIAILIHDDIKYKNHNGNKIKT